MASEKTASFQIIYRLYKP